MRKKILTLTLFATILTNSFSVLAAEKPYVEISEETADGGWNEEQGYFSNIQTYSLSMFSKTSNSTPKHTGKSEQTEINGTTNKRAHGWTTWVDVYHYTRARMEDSGTVLTDSGRQWGTGGTEAISPWWAFNGDTLGTAHTYYGK